MLIVGFAAGDIPRLPLNLPLLKGCAIVGVFWGDFVRREREQAIATARRLAQWIQDGRLQPHVSAVLPLERAADALKLMESRRVLGKVVLQVAELS